MKFSWGLVLKILVALLILFILVASGLLEPEVVVSAVTEKPLLLSMAALVYFALTLVAGGRWFLLMRAAGLDIGLRPTFHLHMTGLFFSSLLPGGAGGDLVKGYYVYRTQRDGRKALALTSVLMDRAVGVYGLVLMGMIVIALNLELALSNNFLRLNALFYFSLFIAATGFVALLLSPVRSRLLDWIKSRNLPGKRLVEGLANSLDTYDKQKPALAAALLLTLVIHGGLTLCFYLILQVLDLDLSFLDNAFVVPVITLINGIPVSPGGIGVTEAAGEVLYRIMGLGDSGSEILALYHVCVLATSLLGMPFYLAYRASGSTR